MDKDDLIGGYIEFGGKLCKVIGHNNGQFAYILQEVEPEVCKECGTPQGNKQFEIIESSLLWSENAKPVKTLTQGTNQ